MEEESLWNQSWISQWITPKLNSFSELVDEHEQEEQEPQSLSMDLILPDDILERILSNLPVASIFRAGSVCRRWNEIVTSKRFGLSLSNIEPHSPWYFMFTGSNASAGHAFDPDLRKWHQIGLPCIESSSWFITSSGGLVSFLDNNNNTRTDVYVCNPITKHWRKLMEPPPAPKLSDYSALAMSTTATSSRYNITIVKSKQVPGNFFQWDLSIQVYDSDTMTWTTRVTEVLQGWRGGCESAICNGVLYLLLYSCSGVKRHGVVTCNVMNGARNNGGPQLIMRGLIPVPCPITCGRLMSMKEEVVMVGGIGKVDRPDVIKGIGVWVLSGGGTRWQEVGRMPRKFFRGFGELDDVFGSSGMDELIYIQSYGAPALLVFDVKKKLWRWSHKCPVVKKFPLQLFSGFCFEPRLGIMP